MREATGLQDIKEGGPTDGVEGLAEVQFEDHSRSFTSVAGTEEVSRVDEVFGNASTRDEPGLVPVNEKRDERLNAIG